MTARNLLHGTIEWFSRKETLAEVRARRPEADPPVARARDQARLLIEVARRTLEPVEALPLGDRAAVVLPLYGAAIRSALHALNRNDSPHAQTQLGGSDDLTIVWNSASAETLALGASEPSRREQVKNILLGSRPSGADEITSEEVASVRAFAESLTAALEAPQRRVERVLGQRWSRLTLVVLLLVVAGIKVRSRVLGPNLAENKPFRTSSTWSVCADGLTCASLMFHTEQQVDPWVEIDLGARRTVHRIEVVNRTDCCSDRAVPLIAEISLDRSRWDQVGIRTEEFSSWTLKFSPRLARYVRLRAPRLTTLHLQEIAVR